MEPIEGLLVKPNEIRCRNEDQKHYVSPHQADCGLIEPSVVRKTLKGKQIERHKVKKAALYLDESGGRRTFATLILLEGPHLFPERWS